MALTRRFTALFTELLARWTCYQQAPRDPERVPELGAARIALNIARADIAAERGRLENRPGRIARKTAVPPADIARLRVQAIASQ